jgi:hypothetical protein
MWAGKCHLSVKSVKLYSLLYKIPIPICTFTTILEIWRSSCSRTTFQWFASKEGFLHSLTGCIVLASHLISYELAQRELGPDCRVDRGEVPTYFSEFSLYTYTSSRGPWCLCCRTKLLELLKLRSSIDCCPLRQKLNNVPYSILKNHISHGLMGWGHCSQHLFLGWYVMLCCRIWWGLELTRSLTSGPCWWC